MRQKKGESPAASEKQQFYGNGADAVARSMPYRRAMCFALLIHLLWVLAAVPVVSHQHRRPASAAAWIAVIGLLPILGTLLYLLAGFRRYPRLRKAPEHPADSDSADRLERIIHTGCGTRMTHHNEVRLLHNGNNAFTALIAALQRATRTIHMEYYIFCDDRIGRTIADILIRTARAGAEVRVIYDAIGSRGMSRALLHKMRAAGVEVHAFEPLRFPWFTPRSTHRNHRKIVVTDGKTAFLGGINIAKYYLDGDGMGKWRDEHLCIEGDAVADLQRLFIADWAHVGGGQLDAAHHIARHALRRKMPLQVAWAGDGPTRPTLAEAFATAIMTARKRIRICSPYFLPPTLLLDALRMAARSGVRVEAMIPSCSDSHMADLISDAYVDDLLDAGIALYCYDNGFLHAKLLLVDDRLASVGTANMDYRSLADNWEVTVFIRDRQIAEELSATFDRDLAACRRITRATWRPSAYRRVLSDVLRLASPLM